MTLKQFLETYRFNFSITNQGNGNLIIITQVIRLNNKVVIETVKTTINIDQTNDWIIDSQSEISLTTWDWDKLIDQTKRAQLDYFAQRVPIEDFFPMNSGTDISKLIVEVL